MVQTKFSTEMVGLKLLLTSGVSAGQGIYRHGTVHHLTSDLAGLDSRGRGLTYDGFFDCARKIRRAEGLLGFYKGGLASYLRVGPHTVLTLMLWTRLRQLEPHLADWAAS